MAALRSLKAERDGWDGEIDRILDHGITGIWRRDALRHAEAMFRRADHAWRSALAAGDVAQTHALTPAAKGHAAPDEQRAPGSSEVAVRKPPSPAASAAPLAAQPNPPAPATLWDERNEAA